MTKKWEFEGKLLGVSTGRLVVPLWNDTEDDVEILDVSELYKREKLEGKKIKITIETLDEEIEEDKEE